MKNKLLIIAIIICSIIIVSFIIFNFFQYNHIKQSKEILKINTYISETTRQVEYLKKHPPITIEKFIKLPDKEKNKAYKDLLNNYNLTLDLLNETIKKLEKEVKQHKKCNDALARKDFMFVSGIAGVGFDQEWNLLGQFGGTINAKIYDAKLLPIKVYFGGGGTYNPRINLQETIHGGTFIIQTTFLIGK